MLFIGNDVENENIVKHEYGHYLQLQEMGFGGYISNVAAPSVTAFWLNKAGKLSYDYYGSPWEHDANEKGEACFTYELWPDDAPKNFFELIPLFFD